MDPLQLELQVVMIRMSAGTHTQEESPVRECWSEKERGNWEKLNRGHLEVIFEG